jgi:hypothetical protein
MKVDGNLPVVLQVNLNEANMIISALNSKMGEIVGLINIVQQQASAQVTSAQTDEGNSSSSDDKKTD